jgi:hypothetical protein
MKLFVHKAAVVLALLAATLGGPAGCASMNGMPAGTAHPARIWQLGDQFVVLEKQDRAPGAPITDNAHPADISPQRFLAMLGSLEFRSSDDARPVPLFTAHELDVLSENISKGLAAAGPDEDVTFAVIGLHPSVGFLKESGVTTGRVFFADRRLQLIIGQAHEPVRESDDRRLKPFLPGSRTVAAPPSWRIVAAAGAKAGHTADRQDWLYFPLNAPEREAVSTPHPSADETVTGHAPVVPPQAPQAARSSEERLIILEGLKNKGLITPEEYRSKRKEILDGL